MVLTDSRFVRNRGRAKGKRNAGAAPIPLPKTIAALATSMITRDAPEHRRLRGLVNTAFTPRAVGKLEHRGEEISHELLDSLAKRRGSFDLLAEYARPVPMRVISEMVGLEKSEIARFTGVMRVLSEGLSGWAIARTLIFDLPASRRFLDGLIARKRADPGDDVRDVADVADLVAELGPLRALGELTRMVDLTPLALGLRE
jgi:cytochrome P450